MNDRRLTSFQLNVIDQRNLIASNSTDKYRIIHKFGANFAIGTAIEDIQSNGGIYNWPTSPFKVEVVSTDPDDTAEGNGARSVIVQGLRFIGGNLTETQEEISLNGLTPSVGLVDFFRINRAFIEKSGVYATTTALSQQGTINIQTEGGGEIHAQLLLDTIGFGQSLIARFSLPSNAFGYLQGISSFPDSTKPVKYFLFQRTDSNIINAPFTAKRIVLNSPAISQETILKPQNPFEFTPNTDIWFAGIATTGSDNELGIDFELTLKFFEL